MSIIPPPACSPKASREAAVRLQRTQSGGGITHWPYYPPILGYHRVGESQGDHVPTVSAAVFDRHLRWLARFKFQVVSLETLLGCMERGVQPPRRGVVITFDDGYEETCSVAWPLLQRHRYPATVFVTPNEVGLSGFASWTQLEAMAQDNLSIGSHTLNHAFLPLADEERLRQEILESKQAIESRLNRPVALFSYPIGGYTPQAQVVVRDTGYRGACTTNRGSSRWWIDPFALRRIKMTERDGQLIRFLAKVSGYYDTFRQLESPA